MSGSHIATTSGIIVGCTNNDTVSVCGYSDRRSKSIGLGGGWVNKYSFVRPSGSRPRKDKYHTVVGMGFQRLVRADHDTASIGCDVD
jgi:hypothetical protein